MKKRIVALFLCLITCVSFTACTNKIQTPDFEKIEYSEYEPFRFYCYGTPRTDGTDYNIQDQFRYIAECGFNYAVPLLEDTTEKRIAVLEGLAPYGVKVIISEPYVGNLFELYKMGKEEDVILSAQDNVKKMYDIYCQYDNFAGFNVKDEPKYNELQYLAKTYEYFETINTNNKEWWINLFPNWGMGTLGSSFGDYVDTAAKITGSTIMCYDTYPLDKANSINPGYWTEMEQFASVSRANGKDWMCFILSEGHQTYKNVKDYDDLAYQVYSQILFGSVGINTFKYHSSGTVDALISKDGRRTSLYYGMQQLIKEVKAFENIYMNSTWQGVMVKAVDEFYGNEVFDGVTNPLEEHERIKSFKGTADLAIGAFKDKDGRDGFLVFNANNPADDTENEVTIKFKNAKYAYLYKKGRKIKLKLNNGTFKTKMGSCEAYYVVPV